MIALEDALADDRDTEVVHDVKNICEVYQLGLKKRGPDLASQYLTHLLSGHTPGDPDRTAERKKVIEKRYTGDVLRELSEAFGSAMFFVLPPGSPSL